MGSAKRFRSFQFYIICLACLAIVFYVGFRWGNVHFLQQKERILVQQESVRNLKSENEEKVKSLNILGVELELAKLTQTQHFAEMAQSIERENALRKQIAFYQKVMAPELTEDGFVIDGFYLEPTLSDHSYRFDLVLLQQNKSKNTLKGTIDVQLMGSKSGIAVQYSLESLLTRFEQQKLSFSFKYFQVIEGEIKLPDGFQPEQISVHAEIFQFKRKKGELTTVFDWSPKQVD